MRSADKTKRTLPKRFNPCLTNPPLYQELVEMRRLGSTNLGEKTGSSGLFSYVHLRVALPPLDDQELFGNGAPESYFLMRRSKDGFVSSTGMFKASFPWAKKSDEEAEKRYVKEHFENTSKEETAGNVWVDPVDALALADEYGMRLWIEALLDNEPVMPSDHRKRNITPPPVFYRTGDSDAGSVASSVPPSSATRRRSTRSMSPSKRIATPRKSRVSKAHAAKDSSLKKEVPMIAETVTEETSVETTSTIPTLTNGEFMQSASVTTPAKKEPSLKVEVDEAVETNGDIEVKTTHVKLELPTSGEPPSPESTEEMLAKAREMVAEARKLEGEQTAPKRKADDTERDEAEGSEAIGAAPQKKAKVLQDQLRKERVKTRAWMGLSATLAIGALLPYVL